MTVKPLLGNLLRYLRGFDLRVVRFVWPNFGANSRHICHTVHTKDIPFSSFLFFRWFPLVCCLQRRESEPAVAWLWFHCGCEGPLVAPSHPSPE